LKPENLLLYADDDTSIKIADFGFAERTDGFISLKTQCGTPGYVAPEILLGLPYGKAVDMWAIGVIIYVLLGGYPPFKHDDNTSIKAAEYEFHPEYWDQVSDDAKDLIRKLLRKDPLERWSAEEALKHPWMTLDEADLSRNLGTNLEMFQRSHGSRRFKSAVKAIIAARRMSKVLATFGIKKTLKFENPEHIKTNETKTYPNGAVYSGDLLDGLKHGKGTYESMEEEIYYDGWWEADKKHGKGNLICEKVSYNGDWRNDRSHGTGTLNFNDGGVYVGDVIEDFIRHGRGRYVSPDGEVLDGEWEHDRFV
jgi:serine/threonine protein kinase